MTKGVTTKPFTVIKSPRLDFNKYPFTLIVIPYLMFDSIWK